MPIPCIVCLPETFVKRGTESVGGLVAERKDAFEEAGLSTGLQIECIHFRIFEFAIKPGMN
jgi:hypothetical protein